MGLKKIWTALKEKKLDARKRSESQSLPPQNSRTTRLFTCPVFGKTGQSCAPLFLFLSSAPPYSFSLLFRIQDSLSTFCADSRKLSFHPSTHIYMFVLMHWNWSASETHKLKNSIAKALIRFLKEIRLELFWQLSRILSFRLLFAPWGCSKEGRLSFLCLTCLELGRLEAEQGDSLFCHCKVLAKKFIIMKY